MQRSNAKPVGDIVRMFMRQEGLEAPYNEYKLIEAWNEVNGEGVSRYTGELFIKNQTLVVKISSPVVKNELSMKRKKLVQQLNNKVGAQVITDIRFV